MSDNTVVKIEPQVQLSKPKKNAAPKAKPEPVELEDVVGKRLMVVLTALATAAYGCWTLGDRRRMQQLLLLMAGGLVVQIGIIRLVIALMHQHQ